MEKDMGDEKSQTSTEQDKDLSEGNPEKEKEPCLSFIEKTNSEICAIVKKQLNITKSKIKNETTDASLKNLASSLQPSIDKNSQVKYLD